MHEPADRPSSGDIGQAGGLLILRLTAGGFLVWEVLDNLLSSARMQEFATFLAAHGYPWPALLAPLSVWFQCLAGSAWLLGLSTRCVSVVIALHFLLAWVTVHLHQPMRAGWPALALIAMAAVLATHGPGRWSVDAWLQRRSA
jgi:putative oxidoreductase